jgi:hypothetical protein
MWNETHEEEGGEQRKGKCKEDKRRRTFLIAAPVHGNSSTDLS